MANIAAAERLHGAGQAVGGARRHQQMHVVGHQHVGMNRATMVQGGCSEPVVVTAIVLRREEDRFAIVAALDHMQRLIGQKVASEPRHGRPPSRDHV